MRFCASPIFGDHSIHQNQPSSYLAPTDLGHAEACPSEKNPHAPSPSKKRHSSLGGMRFCASPIFGDHPIHQNQPSSYLSPTELGHAEACPSEKKPRRPHPQKKAKSYLRRVG